MDETVLKNEIAKLATNFRGKVNVEQTFSLWRDVFRSTPNSNFIMAGDKPPRYGIPLRLLSNKQPFNKHGTVTAPGQRKS